MYNVLKLNKIAAIGTDRLGADYSCADSVENPDAILVRSASSREQAPAQTISPRTSALSRASLFSTLPALTQTPLRSLFSRDFSSPPERS